MLKLRMREWADGYVYDRCSDYVEEFSTYSVKFKGSICGRIILHIRLRMNIESVDVELTFTTLSSDLQNIELLGRPISIYLSIS